LIAVGVVLPVAVGLASGSLDIARNDDWTYRRLAVDLFTSGRLELDGSLAAVVGQLLFAQPFLLASGGQTWGLSIAGIVFASVAVLAGYLLVRRVLPRGPAVFAILLLPLFPGYLPYATSFMTDVPALAADFVCLGLGSVAIQGGVIRWRWLVVSLIVGGFGFSVREFALAAPASVIALAVLMQPRRLAPWIGAIALTVACVAIFRWRSLLVGQIDVVSREITDETINRVRLVVSSIAFVILPATVITAARWWRRWHPFDVVIGLVIALALQSDRLFELVSTRTMPQFLLDNLMTQWGTPGPYVLAGGRPPLFADDVWSALNGLAFVATFVLLGAGTGIVGALLRAGPIRRTIGGLRSGSPLALLMMFASSTALGLVLYGLVGTMIDRYVWPIIPPIAALLLAARPPSKRAERFVGPDAPGEVPPTARGSRPLVATFGAGACAGVLAVMSLMFLLNSAAFDGARWRAGESLVRAGVPADSIDAGFEWVGYHASGFANYAHPVRALTWWAALWPSFHMCGLVSSQPQNVPGGKLVSIDVEAYRLILFGGPEEPLYTYRITGPGCP
jgi:hypothetical protein